MSTDHFFLDRPQQKQLITWLREIVWLSDELDTVITRQAAYGDRYRSGGKSTETPLPFQVSASDVAFDLNGTLTAWVEEVCTSRNLDWPGRKRTPEAAEWLNHHIVDLALCEQAGTAFDEINHVRKRVLSAIDRPVPQEFVGPCQSGTEGVSCEGVYCVKGDDVKKCRTCLVVIDIPSVRAATESVMGDRLYSLPELQVALAYFGKKKIHRRTVESWVAADRLASHGGRYLLNDALKLLGEHKAKDTRRKIA